MSRRPYALVRTQLPTVENIEAFSAAHEIGIAQLAIEYCNALVEDPARRTAYFPGFVFTAQPSVAFADRNLVLNPLIDKAMNIGLGSQPTFTDVQDELGYIVTPDYINLIDRLIASDTTATGNARWISRKPSAPPSSAAPSRSYSRHTPRFLTRHSDDT